jgi:hypothetical protein
MGLQSANRSVWDDKGVRAIVRFTQGDHSSIIDPVASVGATAEMQGQMIKLPAKRRDRTGDHLAPVVKFKPLSPGLTRPRSRPGAGLFVPDPHYPLYGITANR